MSGVYSAVRTSASAKPISPGIVPPGKGNNWGSRVVGLFDTQLLLIISERCDMTSYSHEKSVGSLGWMPTDTRFYFSYDLSDSGRRTPTGREAVGPTRGAIRFIGVRMILQSKPPSV